VRRAVLLNIEHSSKTLPFIIERTADVDPKVRKVVYKKTIKDMGDFRKIPLENREAILRNGLSDRYSF
jgi:condensin complex subunit 3